MLVILYQTLFLCRIKEPQKCIKVPQLFLYFIALYKHVVRGLMIYITEVPVLGEWTSTFTRQVRLQHLMNIDSDNHKSGVL